MIIQEIVAEHPDHDAEPMNSFTFTTTVDWKQKIYNNLGSIDNNTERK